VFNFQVSGEKLTGTIEDWQVSLATFQEAGKPAMSGTLKTQRGEPQQITREKSAAIPFPLRSSAR